MHLINTTGAPARLDSFEVEGSALRAGLLTAKQTFRFDLTGQVHDETQEPFPLLEADQATPLGLLPNDLQPRQDSDSGVFEVILLGSAYAPAPGACRSLAVRLRVGVVEREMRVHGDRVWTRATDGAATISPAKPFTRMPLVFERAFGGRQVAWLDETTRFELRHPTNPEGLGFDAEAAARDFDTLLRCPAGFPRLDDYARRLPNLEHARHPIRAFADDPEPCCWATLPPGLSLASARYAKRQSKRLQTDLDDAEALEFDQAQHDALLYRAHPDWVIPLPPPGARVSMENLSPDAPRVSFELPAQHLCADYVLDGMQGCVPLVPQRLVLLPEQRSFYIVSSAGFRYAFAPGSDRSFRLRRADGWYVPAREESAT